MAAPLRVWATMPVEGWVPLDVQAKEKSLPRPFGNGGVEDLETLGVRFISHKGSLCVLEGVVLSR